MLQKLKVKRSTQDLLWSNSMGAHIRPGELEVFYGAMYSGKTESLIDRVKNRYSEDEYLGVWIPSSQPEEIVQHITSEHRVLVIDEAQFFDIRLEDVVLSCLEARLNVLVAGLNLDFRRRGFGCMPNLIARADHLHRKVAVCSKSECEEDGVYTQRIVNGLPANYDDPLVVIEDTDQTQTRYEVRCTQCYELPGEPRFEITSR
jgi:thymidine kinase